MPETANIPLWVWGCGMIVVLLLVPFAFRKAVWVLNVLAIGIALATAAIFVLAAWLLFDAGATTLQIVFFAATVFVYVAVWVEHYDPEHPFNSGG